MNEKYIKVAKKALESYNLSYSKVEYFIEETNIFFKVYSDSMFMLKIFQEESSTLEDNLVEVYFLNQISKTTDIRVPKVMLNKYEEPITIVENIDFDTIKRVALYDFIEGDEFNGNETNELFFELGMQIAKIHDVSDKLNIPKEIIPKKWDKIFYYRDETPIYNNPENHKFYCDDDRLLLDKIIPFFNQELRKRYDFPHYLIHGDLNPWNIKVHNKEIRFLDFEEGLIGNEIMDLSICLFYYRYDPNYNYQEVKDHIFEGYRTIRKLREISDYEIDFYIIARTLNFINYILVINDNPSSYIQERMRRVREFISNYSISLD